jgi:hypothetical protein
MPPCHVLMVFHITRRALKIARLPRSWGEGPTNTRDSVASARNDLTRICTVSEGCEDIVL